MTDTEQIIELEKQELVESEQAVGDKRRFRDFLFLFSGQQISLLGSSIVSFAIIWWLTITTQSELMLGIASLVSLGPYLLVAPFSGVLADKFNKKFLLIVIDAFQAMLTITLSILFLTNNISVAVVLVILGLRGTAQAFHAPVSMSITPTMVPQKHLSRMNGIGYLFGGLVNIIGPVLGATLLAIPGATIGLILWIDVITFSIAIIPMFFIKIPKVTSKEDDQVKQSFILQTREGFQALNETKGMVALLFTAMLVNFFMSPLTGLLSLFINKIHNGTESDYATVIAMVQAAIVIGGLFMSFFKGAKKPVLFFMISVFIQVGLQIALAFVPTTLNSRFWVIGSILFVYALPFAVLDVTFMTIIQLLIPKEKLGRVLALIMAISPAMRPLGQFLAGVIAEYVGIIPVIIVSGALAALTLLTMYIFAPLRELDRTVTKMLTDRAKAKNKEDLTSDLETVDELKIDEEIKQFDYYTQETEAVVEPIK